MNIYLHELKTYRRNTLLWTVSLCAGTALMFWMFPAFALNLAAVQGMLANYPVVVQMAFGLSIKAIGNVTGFYSFIITFLMLCGAVQAMNIGISVLSRETTGKTADFLLTKPCARSAVLTAKLLAAFTCIAVTSAAFIGASVAMASAVQNAPIVYKPFLLMSLAFFFVQVIFLAIGFCVAAIVPKIRSVLPVSLSTVFGFFIIGMVASSLNRSDLYYLTPFKYFDTIHILETSSYQTSFAVTAAVVTVAAVLTAYVWFLRRDIHAS